MTVAAAASVLLVAFFVLEKGVPALREQGWSFIFLGGWDYDLASAWEYSTGATFGARPLLAGTIVSTLLALGVTAILGMGTAVFVAELAPRAIRAPIEALVQLLAGIPSVVFGLVGVAVVVPWVTEHVVPEDAWDVVPATPIDGASLLSAVIVLSIMIMPFFVAVAVDTLRAIPRSYISGGLALGLTKWRTISKIQIPAATPGLIAGLMLAAARAVGEAIALSMVAGSLALTPSMKNGPLYYLLTPVRTMASTIVETGGEAMSIDSIQGALFGLATLLLLFSLALSLAARGAYAWFARKTQLSGR
jgi:phosphate transport system permease protein